MRTKPRHEVLGWLFIVGGIAIGLFFAFWSGLYSFAVANPVVTLLILVGILVIIYLISQLPRTKR